MSRKKKIGAVVLVVIGIVISILLFRYNVLPEEEWYPTILLSLSADRDMELQIFYKDDSEFSEELSKKMSYSTSKKKTVFSVPIEKDSHFVRIDFGEESSRVQIDSIKLQFNRTTSDLKWADKGSICYTNDIEELIEDDGSLTIQAAAEDPYIVFDFSKIEYAELYQKIYQRNDRIYRIFTGILVWCLIAICIRYAGVILSVPTEIIKDRDIFWDLMKNDLQARFAGNYLGVFWAFFQPIITIILYWFVFQVGLRAGSVSKYPFIVYLMSGLVPWFYFSEAWNGSSNSLNEYSYLVKKVLFNIDILPALKIASSMFVHLFFVVILASLCMIYGFIPNLCWFQWIYYVLAMTVLTLGLGTITAACTAFFKDMTQIVNIILMIGIWVTPIMWNPEVTIPGQLQVLFRLNPMYYIVDGFRDAMLAKRWFWEKPLWTCYFWLVTIIIYIFSIKLYQKLKIHFADVL